MPGPVTRFAPSPTGPLHLGHAYAAQVAHDLAQAGGGRFLLRIEDIDRARARPEWEAAIHADLAWLGLRPEGPVLRQSTRLPAYRAALQRLWDRGLLYPCRCNRRDIALAASAPQEGVTTGPDGPVYPGTCRPGRPPQGPMPRDTNLRLNMKIAVQHISNIEFIEEGTLHRGRHRLTAPELVGGIGDVVLARRDFGTSYHLAVVVDDAAQGVTLVSRGADLFAATPIHLLLQRLLDLPQLRYHHHALVRDDAGRRLAKRDDARALALCRAQGLTPAQVLALAAGMAR